VNQLLVDTSAWVALFNNKVFSFTDCVSFGMMHTLGIYQAFSFDEDFARAGFVMRP
jgi:predicted nucleic acid-binding protein